MGRERPERGLRNEPGAVARSPCPGPWGRPTKPMPAPRLTQSLPFPYFPCQASVRPGQDQRGPRGVCPQGLQATLLPLGQHTVSAPACTPSLTAPLASTPQACFRPNPSAAKPDTLSRWKLPWAEFKCQVPEGPAFLWPLGQGAPGARGFRGLQAPQKANPGL